MIGIVAKTSAVLEQNSPADIVVRHPLLRVYRRY